MPYHGFPLDEEVHRAYHLKNFRDSYGDEANAQLLYSAQPIWVRFAPLFPRTAFLLDSLYSIYAAIDSSLLDFRIAMINFDPNMEDYWVKINPPYDNNTDPFGFFSDLKIEEAERACLLVLRWTLQRKETLNSLFRECAHDLIVAAKSEDRKLIREELLQTDGEVADAIKGSPPGIYAGIWSIRKRILLREEMLDGVLVRIKDILESSTHAPVSADPSPPRSHRDHIDTGPSLAFEYGEGSVPEMQNGKKNAHFASSPPHSISPAWSPDRGRHGRVFRSESRDSARSSIAPGSSVTTWAPEAPPDFSLSIKMYSGSTNRWEEGIALMDSGCDAGNFVSSSFLEEQLDLGHLIEEDPEADDFTLMDFSGGTDYKPRGRVKLRWYGRNINKGRKGKRSIHFEDYFHVAPRLPEGQSGEPFQVLLGKDWMKSNEVFTYHGLRLFRSKKHSKHDPVEHDRRERLRQRLEDERRVERQASDATSVLTVAMRTPSQANSSANSPHLSSRSQSTLSSAASNGSDTTSAT
jgi:hypothetical protein